MKVAIVHYWLVGMRGGEKVLEALCRMFPEADLFTHVCAPDAISDTLNAHTIKETYIARFPFARRMYQSYLPFMPGALESLDLSGYDLVISSEAGPAKGGIAPPDAFHLCYVHSPMRYLWDQYHTYRDGAGMLAKAMMPLLAPRLRMWDVTSAARVDHFMANSTHVANRVRKYWRREADVLHPPVAVEDFAPVAQEDLGDFYLWAGELAPYKRPDIAIEAFRILGRPLVVIGGPEKTRAKLAANAPENVTFLGKTDFSTLKSYMARCKALVFPGEEDFGIVPVEVMASGRPVIAYGRGGALDTVKHGETGWLFKDRSVEGLVTAVEAFESSGLLLPDVNVLRTHAESFNETHFRAGISTVLEREGFPL
jgi:glycosyltransferase involved in cell wall biosynthesis